MTLNNTKKPLLVATFGFPGCGKSTMIQSIVKENPKLKIFDIFDYIEKYKDKNGNLTDEQKRLANEGLLNDLASTTGDIIVEYGTNYAELVISRLAEINRLKKVEIVLCELVKDVCIKRALLRAKNVKTRNRLYPSPEYLGEKFDRPFPQQQEQLALEYQLPVHHFDMNFAAHQLAKNFKVFIKKVS
ncbi:MAG: hypothetical protein PHW95_01840 [Patescibacteria group bacterium]|nr:hypothetical protein [Patescibacteria group bacterium]